MINGSYVNWLDAKNYFVTFQDKVKWKRLKQTVAKYSNTFGNGAIVCVGYVKTSRKLPYDVMLLDASYWRLSM